MSGTASFMAADSLQHRQHAPRRREQRRVVVGETEELEAKRKPAIVENRKRERRNAEHRTGRSENRIARGAEADRRGARGRERDAGVEFLAEGMVDRPPPVAIRDMAALGFERPCLPLTAPPEHPPVARSAG